MSGPQPKPARFVVTDEWIEAFLGRREDGWQEPARGRGAKGEAAVPGVVVTVPEAATWATPKPTGLWLAARDVVADVARSGGEPPTFSEALAALRAWAGRRFPGGRVEVSHG